MIDICTRDDWHSNTPGAASGGGNLPLFSIVRGVFSLSFLCPLPSSCSTDPQMSPYVGLWLLLSDSQRFGLNEFSSAVNKELPSGSIRTKVWVWGRYCVCGQGIQLWPRETPEKAVPPSPWGTVLGFMTYNCKPFGYDREGADIALDEGTGVQSILVGGGLVAVSCCLLSSWHLCPPSFWSLLWIAEEKLGLHFPESPSLGGSGLELTTRGK